MSEKVLITGCTGEIGSRLTAQLLNLDYQVFGIRGSKNCDIDNSRHSCRKMNLLGGTHLFNLEEIRPDILIHTAWLTTPNEFWESDQNKQWVKVSKSLISEFIQSGGQYLAVTGSCAEYSWATSNDLSENSLEKPGSPYGEAKLELLNWIRNSGVNYLWSRTFFQYGSKEASGRLIPSLIDSLHNGDKFIVQNGSFTGDFVYVEDVSRILTTLISLKANGVVNIGQGKGLEIGFLTGKIARMMGREDLIEINSNGLSPGYVVSDSEKLNGLVRDISWTRLEETLNDTIIARKSNAISQHKPNRLRG